MKHYIKTWLLIDLAGSTPVNYVVLLMEIDVNKAGSSFFAFSVSRS